jgi:transposase InsO family protein
MVGMARKVTAMETRLLAVFTAGLKSVSVSGLCAELGISRQTFYKYRRRFEAEGPAGLAERSRRPHRSPGMIPAGLEDEIVRLRKELPLDHGAQTIAYHLDRAGWRVPSVSTIHRALVRRGLVEPQPQKRPRSAWRRFEWPAPNGAWQIDATQWVLAGGKEVWIMDLIDDHSRVLLAARVAKTPSGQAAWDAFCDASSRWGLPAHVMSDNGTCFTGRFLSGFKVDFERDLAALGIRHIRSTPGHPQTCGKIERSHQTTKRWLARQRPARTITELQAQLDDWLVFYNQQRPHRALQGAVPAERWAASPPDQPGTPIPEPPRAELRLVFKGRVSWNGTIIGVGGEHTGRRLLVTSRHNHLAIFSEHGLVRRLVIDPSRRYEPTGRPRGPRPRNTLGPCQ